MNLHTTRTGLEIAVIGMAGRFPGAADLEAFWANLVGGENSISLLSEAELRAAGVHPELLRQKNFVKAKGLFPDLEYFDAEFFEYTPRDAAVMDPQVRALHQGVYHALEDAGYASERYKGSIGLFAGASGNFAWELSTLLEAKEGSAAQLATIQLNDKDFVATRIAHKLDLRGPCVTLHSACSTSLYAIDAACRSLLTGACSIAVAAGSGLTLPHRNGYLYEDGMIKSADGACRPFSSDANGTVEGNGMGAVVLKPLEDAMRDRDRIYAVIRGTAANNDGNRKVGYTAPSVEGQAEAIRRALHMADVEPGSISYVEAHGTGTALGDPVEIEGLKKAFRTERVGFCGVGSLKSNIGHLDTAAGISSFIKTVLALDRQLIPPSINFREINPAVDLSRSPFHIVTEATPWTRPPAAEAADGVLPRRAGVSSFGIGGTNVHVVLEEAPALPPSGAGREWKLLCLSARDPAALGRLEEALAQRLESASALDASDIAYTLQTGRRNLAARTAIAYRTTAELAGLLRTAPGESGAALHRFHDVAAQARVAFLFPGQGTQYAGMGRGLYLAEPVFKQEIDRCLAICDRLGLADVRRLLLNPQAGDAERIHRTELAQPCLFVLEHAMARLLMDWGVVPAAMLGHSLGEYVAACVSGVLTLEQALELVILRGRLMQALPGGSMLAVAAPEGEVRALLSAGVEVAAVNAPAHCTVAGTAAALEAFERILQERGVAATRLHTSHAFHSAAMDGVMEPLRQALHGMTLQAPGIAYVSNLTGTWMEPDQAQDPDSYARHLREPVRFADGARCILQDQGIVLVELGPGAVLGNFVRSNAADTPVRSASMVRHAKSGVEDAEHLSRALGDLWGCGVPLDWQRYYRFETRSKVALPAYPFEKRAFPLGRGDVYSLLDDAPAPAAATTPAPQSGPQALGWQTALLPTAEESTAVRPCLVFGRQRKLSGALAQVSGLRVVNVRAGKGFARKGRADYRMDLDRVSDYRRLVRSLRSDDGMPSLIVWMAEDGAGALPRELGNRLLRLALSLRDECPGQALRCVVLTSGSRRTAFPRLPEEDIEIDGLVRGMRAGCPELDLRCLRLDPAAGPQALAELLEREIYDADSSTHLAAYEGRRRSVYRPFPALACGAAPAAALRGATLGLMAPEHYPLDELAARIREASGARLVPLPYRPRAQGGAATALAADSAVLGGYLGRIQERYLAQYGLGDHEPRHALMDRLCTALVAAYIHERMPLVPGHRFDRSELGRCLRITPRFDKYLDYFLSMLAEDGFVVAAAGGYDILRGPQPPDAVAAIKSALNASGPLFAGQVGLLEHCVQAFPAALSEEIRAIEVLYPEGRNELLRDTYAGSIQEREDEYIRLMFEKLIAQVLRGARGKRLRILEAGGGYGVIMRRIVPLLRGMDVEYYFTDIGKTFLADAKDFALAQGYDFMTFGAFDITRDPAEQGLEPASFDLVFSFNVVHATRNVGTSVGNLRRLLKDGGLLCLLERTKIRRYVDLIWGLADGWWHFDEQERALSPLMDLARWEAIAREAGFADVLAYPDAPELRRRLDVGLLIARSPALRAEHDQPSTPAQSPPAGLDGLIFIDLPEAHAAPVFQPLGERLASPRADYDTGATALLDCIAVQRPRFVSVWSAGTSASGAAEEVARVRARGTLQQRAASLLPGPSAWSHVSLAFGGACEVPALDAVRDALGAVAGGLAQAVVRPEAQALFGSAARGSQPARSHAAVDSAGAALGHAGAPPLDLDEYAGLMHGLWTELLGLDAIGLDDDFFGLGGDSLKVAQLTTELEKHGIKLLSNEVYSRPTIRGLAAYLKARLPDAQARIRSADDLLAHYRDTRGIGGVFQTYALAGREYRILFLEDGAFAAAGTLEQELLALDLPDSVQPHYVYPLSRFAAAVQSDAAGFWRALGLAEQAGADVLEAHLGETCDHLQHLSRTVCQGAVTARYALSPFQKMYLKGTARTALYLIDFDEPLDLGLLNRAFTDIVAAQGLLRSSLQRGLALEWAEHEAPRSLSLPVVDLSGYAPAAQTQLFERLMAAEYEAQLGAGPALMYRVSLVRFDRRRHTLLFNLDHSIFDNMSGQVLRRQLVNRYRALRAGNTAPMEAVKSFRDYLEQLNQGPQGIGRERLIELFELRQYETAKHAVEQRIVSRRQPATAKLRYELDLAQLELSDDEEATWEISMVLLCCVLGRFLKQESVPLKIVYQGRKYQDRSYFDTLGLFIDVLPLLVHVDRDDPAAMVEGIRRKVRCVNRYNVSFMNMLLNLKMRFKWWDVLAPVSPKKLKQRDPMLLLNYVGKAEKEYQKVIDFATRQMLNSGQKLDYASFYAIATVADGRIAFDVLCNFEPDMGVLQRLFEEEAARLLAGHRRDAGVSRETTSRTA